VKVAYIDPIVVIVDNDGDIQVRADSEEVIDVVAHLQNDFNVPIRERIIADQYLIILEDKPHLDCVTQLLLVVGFEPFECSRLVIIHTLLRVRKGQLKFLINSPPYE
jgi:hypothetical protein